MSIFSVGTWDVYSKKDALTSLRKALAFLLVYESFTCYVYNARLIKRNEADFLPRMKGFYLKVVSTRPQLNELISAGFDISIHSARAKYRLEKGAFACLVFVGKELASMEWVATNAGAKDSIDNYPCGIDYSKKEAYAGGVWTNPKYRGNGLHKYVYYKIYDFLRENGAATVKSIVEVNNTAALKSHEGFAPEEKKESVARYFRIIGLQFWRERPIKPNDSSGQG